MLLPNTYTINTAAASEWSASFTIENDDGTLVDLTNKTFEFVVRNRLKSPGVVLFSVSSTGTNSYGGITVDVLTATVQVVVTPAATMLITEGGGPYTLWMDPGLPDATALVVGIFYTQPVAAA